MKKQTLALSILVAIALVTLTACGGVAVSTTNQSPVLPAPTQAVPAQAPVPSGATGDLVAAYQGTLENIYTAVSPSVVNIRVVQKVDASATVASQIPGFPFFNLPQGQQPHNLTAATAIPERAGFRLCLGYQRRYRDQ